MPPPCAESRTGNRRTRTDRTASLDGFSTPTLTLIYIPLGKTQFRAISIGPAAGDPYDFHLGPGKGSLNLKITRTSENSVHYTEKEQEFSDL